MAAKYRVTCSLTGSSATNGLPRIGLEIKRGGTLDDIHQLFLVQEIEDVVKWRDPDLSVNFFQLVILNERFDLVQYLAIHHPIFLDTYATYKASNSFTDITDANLLLNAPLHLACFTGNLDIVQFILDHKISGSLSSVSLVNLMLNNVNGNRTINKIETREDFHFGKPFEFAILSENIECIDYLLSNHVIQCLALRFLYAGVREPSSLLHKACSIGSASMIDLLLKRSFKDVLSLCDKNGKTPLHIAAWNGNTQSIKILLQNGANVNCMTESRNCLHILYRSKLNPYNYSINTDLLLSHGLDAHAVDKNGKSALHIICEEIGISHIDVMCYWKKAADAILEMTVTSQPSLEYTVGTYQRVLIECLEILLKHGLDPNQGSYRSVGCQVPLEVLLQYSSLPYSQATLILNPEVVYESIELLLKYGADPNLECRVTNRTIFNQFLVTQLKDLDIEMGIKFINLFCQNGADPELPLSSVDLASFPAVLSVLDRPYGIEAAEIILKYCSLPHLKRVLSLIKTQTIPRLLVRQTSSTESASEHALVYIDKLNKLIKTSPMRSLRHLCKLVIMHRLGRKGSLVSFLPLPQFIKSYLTSSHF